MSIACVPLPYRGMVGLQDCTSFPPMTVTPVHKGSVAAGSGSLKLLGLVWLGPVLSRIFGDKQHRSGDLQPLRTPLAALYALLAAEHGDVTGETER